MRVVITGATGNVGTSLIEVLASEPAVTEIVGLARRRPRIDLPKTRWVEADVGCDHLTAHFEGAGAVVHLAWLIQPERDEALLERSNVAGSARVFAAAREARVPILVHASSVGAYSPSPHDRRVDESWPTSGIATSLYSRQKSAVERELDGFELAHPEVRVVRLRPALIFKRASASEQRRLFLGPLFPAWLSRPGRIPVVPAPRGLSFQAVHSLDVAAAYHLALTRDVRGAFNVAGEPVIDGGALATLLEAKTVEIAASLMRAAMTMAWRLHLEPASPGWLDMALTAPLLDTTRAREVLGWSPRHHATDVLLEVLHGLHDHAGFDTPPLLPDPPPRKRAAALLGRRATRSAPIPPRHRAL
ncbi:MAG: NAD-dependent epimerase/dehydratase family protein [Deltaproteobacteria bacterium]|nr:NAD-dependent epimerase/dehydratase family protein [Deltaproteobacteria bacterium]